MNTVFLFISKISISQKVLMAAVFINICWIYFLRSSEVFDKLEFTKAGKLAFISQVAKMSTHKMSREHVQFLAKKVLEMLDDTDSAESPNVSS